MILLAPVSGRQALLIDKGPKATMITELGKEEGRRRRGPGRIYISEYSCLSSRSCIDAE